MIHKKEAKQVYAMFALLKCAEQYKDYLLGCGGIQFGIKQAMKEFFKRFTLFEKFFIKDVTPEDRKLWADDWKRDFMVYGSVFTLMSEMTDEQRSSVEKYAQEVAEQ